MWGSFPLGRAQAHARRAAPPCVDRMVVSPHSRRPNYVPMMPRALPPARLHPRPQSREHGPSPAHQRQHHSRIFRRVRASVLRIQWSRHQQSRRPHQSNQNVLPHNYHPSRIFNLRSSSNRAILHRNRNRRHHRHSRADDLLHVPRSAEQEIDGSIVCPDIARFVDRDPT